MKKKEKEDVELLIADLNMIEPLIKKYFNKEHKHLKAIHAVLKEILERLDK